MEQQLLEDVKTKRTQTLQRLHNKKDELGRTRDELNTTVDELKRKQEELDRTRDELDVIQDEVEKRKDEVEKKQLDVNRKVDELDKTQDEVEKKRKELTELQRQVDSHLKTINQQRTELQVGKRANHLIFNKCQVPAEDPEVSNESPALHGSYTRVTQVTVMSKLLLTDNLKTFHLQSEKFLQPRLTGGGSANSRTL